MSTENDELDFLFGSDRSAGTKSDALGFTPIGSGRKIRPEDESDRPAPAKPGMTKKKPSTAGRAAGAGRSSSGSGKAKAKKTSKKPASVSSAFPAADRPSGKKAAGSRPRGTGKKSSRKRKVSFKEELLSVGYIGAIAVSGGVKKLFGSRGGRIIVGALLVVILLFGCWKGALSLYRSNTLLSGGGDVIDSDAGKIAEIEESGNRDNVTYFLIVGVDKGKQLTDCIWILCFDNKAHKMNVLQIPRDTYVGEYSMSPHKANAIYESKVDANWCEQCDRAAIDDRIDSGRHLDCGGKITRKKIQGVASLYYFIANELHLPIDHYVFFDFEGFEKAIDALGGVDIYLEKDMDVYYTKSKSIPLHAGRNHLDGAKALKFMRNRKTYAEGDLGRVRAQRQIIHAMLDKVQGLSLLQTLNVVLAANGSFSTDMSLENIKSFISPLKKCKSDDLHMFELPGNARTVRRSSYYLCDDEQTVGLLNQYMLPYSHKLNTGDIDFPDP